MSEGTLGEGTLGVGTWGEMGTGREGAVDSRGGAGEGTWGEIGAGQGGAVEGEGAPDWEVFRTPGAKVLASLFLDAQAAAGILGELSAGDFEEPLFARVFCKARARWKHTGQVDIAWTDLLSAAEQQAVCNCVAYGVNVKHWPRYIQLLREHRALAKARDIGREISAPGLTLETLCGHLERLNALAAGARPQTGLDMAEGVARFWAAQQGGRQPIGTGFARLDRHAAIGPGDFVVVGGRPSAGKTAFSLAMALNMAGAGRRVAYFSLETAPEKLMDRLMACFCRLDFGRVKSRALAGEELARAREGAKKLAGLPLDIIPAAGRGVGWIRGEAARRKAEVVMVDYMGLVDGAGNSRYEKMTAVSVALHEFCQQTGALVVALCQLNRAGAWRAAAMEDLRDSGQIEQDADLVLLLDKEQGAFYVNIAKNKEGAVGDVPMRFLGEQQAFEDL